MQLIVLFHDHTHPLCSAPLRHSSMRLSSVSSDNSIPSMIGGGVEDMDVFTMDHSDLTKINHVDTVEELEPVFSQAVRGGVKRRKEGGTREWRGRREGSEGEGGSEGKEGRGRGSEGKGGREFSTQRLFLSLGCEDILNRGHQELSPGTSEIYTPLLI